MKYLFSFILLIALTITCSAQTTDKGLTYTQILNILKGEWVSQEDSTFTIKIKGDTIIETRLGEAKVFDFTLKKESCDPDADTKLAKKTTTGYFINESSEYDGVEYCNAVVTISDDTMGTVLTDGMIDFKRKK